MATEKVGIYRKYHGPIPRDKDQNALPKSEWLKKRAFRWVVRWFGSDGKRYSKSFKNRKEANKYAEIRQLKTRHGKPDMPKEIDLKSFMEEHLMLMQGQLAYKSIKEHERALRYLLEIIGNKTLTKITPRDAELYLKCRSEAKVSVSTINKELGSLKRLFKIAAQRRQYLAEDQNPFRLIKKRKRSIKALRYVSVTECEKLLAYAPSFKWQVFLSLIYTAGLRLNEACHVTWNDIDFAEGILQVTAKRDATVLVPWEPKDHELRTIPLCESMVDLLTQWQSVAPEKVPYVFLTQERYSWVRQLFQTGKWRDSKELINNVLRDFNVIRDSAGVSKCTLHDLRRSCLTNWARQLPAHVVRKLAGHSSLETTMRYYLIVQDCDLQQVKTVGGNLLSGMKSKAESLILEKDPTDPKLTHFPENGGFGGISSKRKDS